MEYTRVEIISRENIKPSSLFPNHPKKLELSPLDILFPPIYGRTVSFYTGTRQDNKAHILKKSLSQALTYFYPIAGRITKNATFVDCNDEGAHFIEAKINCNVVDFLVQPNLQVLDQFIPYTNPKFKALADCHVCLVQYTEFDCGGHALSVCLNHKIADATALVVFLQSWSSLARAKCDDMNNNIQVPVFTGRSLLPFSNDDFSSLPIAKSNLSEENCVTRRFVFGASQIEGLKREVVARNIVGGHAYHPSRVEVVLGFILKHASKVATDSATAKRLLAWDIAVNLRKRMVPPMPENSMGNIIWQVPILFDHQDRCKGFELHELVNSTREGIANFSKEKASRMRGEEGLELILELFNERLLLLNSKEIEYWRCASLCKIPFYEMDFGWGKPNWVSSNASMLEKTIVLLDTRHGDGVEAWVTMEEQDMLVLERDKEFLALASLNPTIAWD